MQFSNELLRKQCVKSKDEGQEIVCFSVTADNLLTVDSLQLPNDAQKTERYLERDAEGVCCVCMHVHTHFWSPGDEDPGTVDSLGKH